MQDLEKTSRKSQYRLMIGIVFVFFLMVFGYTVFWEIRYYTKYNHFQKVEAVVVSQEVEDGKTYDVLKYIVDGNEYQKLTDYESKNNIGDKVIVYYDINSPIGVIYSLDYRRYALPIITIMFFAVWLSLYIIYRITYPKVKTRVRKKRETPVDMLLGDQ